MLILPAHYLSDFFWVLTAYFMRTNNELPEWAPAILRESIHSHTTNTYSWSQDFLMIERALCTSEHMENAWRSLREKYKDEYSFEFDAFVAEFTIQVYGAYFKREGYGADSKAEMQKKERITHLMTALAKELDNSPYDGDVLKYFSKSELRGLYSIINGAYLPDRLVNKKMHFEIESQIDEGFKTYNSLLAPCLSDILYRSAHELSNIKHEPVLGKEKSTTSDGDFDLHVRWFLRVMAKYFRNKFDSPNYKILADLGNTFFGGADLDEKKVGSILQERRKRLNTTNLKIVTSNKDTK